jgi:hypothetical protein
MVEGNIFLSGSSNGGKSSLARELAKYTNRVVIDYSRPTAAANFLGYDKASDVDYFDRIAFQFAGLIEQIGAEREMKGMLEYAEHADSFISDRCVADFVGYWHTQINLEDRYERPEYEHIAKKWAQNNYHTIIFVPYHGGPIEDNGKRFLTDPIPTQNTILRLFEEWKIMDRVYVLQENTLDKRVLECLRHLKV